MIAKQEKLILRRTYLDICSGIKIPGDMHTMHARIGSFPILVNTYAGVKELSPHGSEDLHSTQYSYALR
jgi:hypothetical protein